MTAGAIAAAIVAACVALTASHVIALVVLAQVVLVLLMVAVSIPLTGRLHDAMPSSIRAGVASGVGTLTWLTFLPFAFVFGAVSDRSGVHTAGWTLGALALTAVLLMAVAVRGFRRAPNAVPLEAAFAADAFQSEDDPYPGHWVESPAPWEPSPVEVAPDLATAAVGKAIQDLPSPSTT